MDTNSGENPDKRDVIKFLSKAMDQGELYSCDNFTIFAKVILKKDKDFEYEIKFAVVYDEQADVVVTGELGLCFTGQKMFKGKIIEYLQKENRLKDLWDPQILNETNHLSEFLIEDEDIIDACSELVNEDYRAKLNERIKNNAQFLDELIKLKEDLNPSDPNFGESFLTLETAITEITEKIDKLRNLLEFGGTDVVEPL
ncbi:MAG: hypothetical protein ACTSRG_14170 [Candidatus Helarchaeota archaeon]